MRRRNIALPGLILIAVMLSACGNGAQAGVVATQPEGGGISVSDPTPTLPVSPAPEQMGPGSQPTVTAPSSPTPVALTTPENASATPQLPLVDPVTPLPNATATMPPPTFTPPPPPPPDPAEHYVLNRPVPVDSAQWTDKAYPYGSTRGGTLQVHHGVEFVVPTGTPVLAALNGIVRFAGPDDSLPFGPRANFYGQVVVLEHAAVDSAAEPLFTVYGHLSEFSVEVGEAVLTGEQIGLSGDSGVAYGPHLHFEVRQGTNQYTATRNPLLWLRPFPGLGTVAARISWPDGQPVLEAPVILRRVDGPTPYTGGTTYAAGSVNGDDVRQENLVLDDVVPGFYELALEQGNRTVRETIWVYPDRTTFLAITLP